MQAEVERLFGERQVIGVLEKGVSRTLRCERVHVRIESERLGEFGPRLVEIAAQAQRPRKIQMIIPDMGICRARLSEEIDRLIHVPRRRSQLARDQ